MGRPHVKDLICVLLGEAGFSPGYLVRNLLDVIPKPLRRPSLLKGIKDYFDPQPGEERRILSNSPVEDHPESGMRVCLTVYSDKTVDYMKVIGARDFSSIVELQDPESILYKVAQQIGFEKNVVFRNYQPAPRFPLELRYQTDKRIYGLDSLANGIRGVYNVELDLHRLLEHERRRLYELSKRPLSLLVSRHVS